MTIEFTPQEVYEVFQDWLRGQWEPDDGYEWVVYLKGTSYHAYQKRIEKEPQLPELEIRDQRG